MNIAQFERNTKLIELQNILNAHNVKFSVSNKKAFATNRAHVENLIHYVMKNYKFSKRNIVDIYAFDTLDIDMLMENKDADIAYSVLVNIIKNKIKFTINDAPIFVDYFDIISHIWKKSVKAEAAFQQTVKDSEREMEMMRNNSLTAA